MWENGCINKHVHIRFLSRGYCTLQHIIVRIKRHFGSIVESMRIPIRFFLFWINKKIVIFFSFTTYASVESFHSFNIACERSEAKTTARIEASLYKLLNRCCYSHLVHYIRQWFKCLSTVFHCSLLLEQTPIIMFDWKNFDECCNIIWRSC